MTVAESEVNIALPTDALPFPELKLAYEKKVSLIRGRTIGYPVTPKNSKNKLLKK